MNKVNLSRITAPETMVTYLRIMHEDFFSIGKTVVLTVVTEGVQNKRQTYRFENVIFSVGVSFSVSTLKNTSQFMLLFSEDHQVCICNMIGLPIFKACRVMNITPGYIQTNDRVEGAHS